MVQKEIKARLTIPELLRGTTISRQELKATMERVAIVGVPSNPPTGNKSIINLYWNPESEELVFITED
jgi:hypothetical protein